MSCTSNLPRASRPRERGPAGPAFTLRPVSGPDRLEQDGRVLLTRPALAQVTGEHRSTLHRWWTDRARNGHPDGEEIGEQLYFDLARWRAWRTEHGADRRTVAGRALVTRRELNRISGVPVKTLTRWYTHRADNGHPEGVLLDRRLYVDEQDWVRWHGAHRDAQRADLTEVERSGDPDELLTAAEAARLLGYRNDATVRAYVQRGQFIAPDAEEPLPSGRVRLLWTRRRLWEFAARRSWSRSAKTPPVTP